MNDILLFLIIMIIYFIVYTIVYIITCNFVKLVVVVKYHAYMNDIFSIYNYYDYIFYCIYHRIYYCMQYSKVSSRC